MKDLELHEGGMEYRGEHMTPDKVEERVTQFELNHGQYTSHESREDAKAWLRTTLTQYHQDMMSEVVEALTKEHYGISYETDKCIECSNHDRIKEALTIIKSK